MTVNNPYSQYVENQFKTASPGKLLIMAYDAAIKFAKIAAEKMKEGKLDQQSENIRKVQNIILELMSSLDMKVDRQLAENLYSLYSYIFDRLTHANIKDDIQALEEVIQILCELRQTWAEAEILARSSQSKLEAKAA